VFLNIYKKSLLNHVFLVKKSCLWRVRVRGIDKEVESSDRGEYWRLLTPGTYYIQVGGVLVLGGSTVLQTTHFRYLYYTGGRSAGEETYHIQRIHV
jgi:hypothetical protein